MEIEEIGDRQTFREYKMVHLSRSSALGGRWQIMHFEGGIDRHQGFAQSEVEARAMIDGLIEKRNR